MKIVIDKIDRNYYGRREIFHNKTITIEDGLTVISGCTGYGKSTLISIINNCLKYKKKNNTIVYDNSFKNKIKKSKRAGFHMRLESCSGDDIIDNLIKVFDIIDKMIYFIKYKDLSEREIYVLLDSIDYGISPDVIKDILDMINKLLDECKKLEIKCFVILATTEFEFAKNHKCLDLYTGKYIEMSDNYYDFNEYMNKTRETKDYCENRYLYMKKYRDIEIKE